MLLSYILTERYVTHLPIIKYCITYSSATDLGELCHEEGGANSYVGGDW